LDFEPQQPARAEIKAGIIRTRLDERRADRSGPGFLYSTQHEKSASVHLTPPCATVVVGDQSGSEHRYAVAHEPPVARQLSATSSWWTSMERGASASAKRPLPLPKRHVRRKVSNAAVQYAKRTRPAADPPCGTPSYTRMS
jgi:hypothetical protein